MPDLLIRAFEPRDLDAVAAIVNLPGVRRGTMRMPFTPRSLIEGWFPDQPGLHRLVADRGEGAVGLATLMQGRGRRAHAGEVGMMVHDDHAGRGVGTALLAALLDLADNWVGLRRVELTVNVDNDRAIRLYERAGFEREGLRRADALRVTASWWTASSWRACAARRRAQRSEGGA